MLYFLMPRCICYFFAALKPYMNIYTVIFTIDLKHGIIHRVVPWKTYSQVWMQSNWIGYSEQIMVVGDVAMFLASNGVDQQWSLPYQHHQNLVECHV